MRKPPIYLRAILLITGAKYTPQIRLFVEHHERVKDGGHAETVDSQVCGAKEQRPTTDDRQNSHVHGIARVPVQATHDERRWRIGGGGCPSTRDGEVPQAPRRSKRREA